MERGGRGRGRGTNRQENREDKTGESRQYRQKQHTSSVVGPSDSSEYYDKKGVQLDEEEK